MSHYIFTATIFQIEMIYVAKCAEIDVVMEGDTPEEALENLKEAVARYLDDAKALGVLDEATEGVRSQYRFQAVFEVAA